MQLWYRKPAERWSEALPLGNGRMGAMIYGKTDVERIDLSEITCFSGEPSLENNREGAGEFFLKAREASIAGDYAKARSYLENFIGRRLNYGTNLPIGHLVIRNSEKNTVPEGYKRSLSIENAIAESSYGTGRCSIAQKAFISAPHQVFVMRITGTGKGPEQDRGLDLDIALDGDNNEYNVETDLNGDLLLYGKALESIHSDGSCGVSFHGRLRALVRSGTASAAGNELHIRKSDEVLLILNVATNYDISDLEGYCLDRVDRAAALSYEELLDEHLADYHKLFNRVSLKIGSQIDAAIPTDELLEKVRQGEHNPALTALMFQYGRYLLISSSRENSPVPAHLQGVWNDSVASRIGWTCDMHLDINTQMNYWPAEVTNLSECHKPLFHWIKSKLVPSGRLTAAKSYHLKGWVAELVSNCWGFTAPYWHTNLSPCPTGGVWLLSHLWEHYLYSEDMDFLREYAYPIIKEAVEFFVDYIFVDPGTGYITSGPSVSPENSFIVGQELYTASIGPTYEIVMIRELFDIFLKASDLLGSKDCLVERAEEAVNKLRPFEIDNRGEVKEWSHDYASADPQHRHTSHLLSLFPFAQITPDKTPKLAEAARVCLHNRMTPAESWEDTGWARSMLMLYSARLRDSEEVFGHIFSMQKHLTNCNLMVKHPPTRGAPSFADVYELDGNTGLTACIAEALLQSHQGEIHLLPALPPQWNSGEVKGLCARGGYVVDIRWDNGIPAEAAIRAKYAKSCVVRYGNKRIYIDVPESGAYHLDGAVFRR